MIIIHLENLYIVVQNTCTLGNHKLSNFMIEFVLSILGLHLWDCLQHSKSLRFGFWLSNLNQPWYLTCLLSLSCGWCIGCTGVFPGDEDKWSTIPVQIPTSLGPCACRYLSRWTPHRWVSSLADQTHPPHSCHHLYWSDWRHYPYMRKYMGDSKICEPNSMYVSILCKSNISSPILIFVLKFECYTYIYIYIYSCYW